MDCRLVFTIWSLRGLLWGWSAAPTSAIKDVQNSISTMPRAPSSAIEIEGESGRKRTSTTYSLNRPFQMGRSL